jgi:hypothetical protein
VTGEHAGQPLPDDVEKALAETPARRPSKHVRVTTDAPTGSDPNPTPEAPRGTGTENDARLKADKPPHWG